MSWRYTPVAIHLECHHQQHAVSGAFLLNTFTGYHYVVTITDIPDPERYHFRFVSPWCIGTTTISWLPLVLCDTKKFNQQGGKSPRTLIDFAEGLQKNDRFEFNPNDSSELRVLHLRIPPHYENTLVESFHDVDNLQPLVFKPSSSVPIPSKISIQCCPFGLTNVAIFVNHRLFGSVILSLNGTGFLSDIKYLDDAIGGIVSLDTPDHETIGLVCGSLNKINGDGELLLIVSWDSIFELLDYPRLRFPGASTTLKTSESLKKSSDVFHPARTVVRISVHYSDGRFWGSGVCLSDRWIVTNKHVLKSASSLIELMIRVPFQPDLAINIDDVVIHETPLQGFDLCFIRLKVPCLNIVPAKLPPLFTNPSRSLQIGQRVKSVGHGLFFSRDSVVPLSSQGRINNIVELDSDGNGKNSGAMLISSAGCWNGSSGGGLFNERDELVGIMTSNGKLSTGEVMPNFTLSIPIDIVEKSVFLLENELPPVVDMKEKIQELWSLRGTREHVLEASTLPPTHKL